MPTFNINFSTEKEMCFLINTLSLWSVGSIQLSYFVSVIFRKGLLFSATSTIVMDKYFIWHVITLLFQDNFEDFYLNEICCIQLNFVKPLRRTDIKSPADNRSYWINACVFRFHNGMLSLICKDSVFLFIGKQGPLLTHKMQGLLLTEVSLIQPVMFDA